MSIVAQHKPPLRVLETQQQTVFANVSYCPLLNFIPFLQSPKIVFGWQADPAERYIFTQQHGIEIKSCQSAIIHRFRLQLRRLLSRARLRYPPIRQEQGSLDYGRIFFTRRRRCKEIGSIRQRSHDRSRRLSIIIRVKTNF
ncbi:hypothetical protein CKO36_01875 [Rhabdochromatium marinum]|nr:hypothetical protein [Rhabdochromatium marinum]